MIEGITQGQGQDSVSPLVQKLLIENSILAQIFFNVSPFVNEGDTSISFPYNKNRFNVQKLSGAQKGDDQELILELDKLPLDQEAHIQWVVKKFDQSRSKQDILANAINNATQEHAVSLDEDIRDALMSVVGNTPITGTITQDKVVDAITAANIARIPKAGRRWVFGNGSYGTLLKIDGFVDASKSNMNIVMTGQIGELYGIPVFESDVFASNEAVLAHSEAVAFGFGAAPAIEDQKVIEYGTGSRRWVMDQMYGTKNLHEGKMFIHLTGQ